jgi:hypothetical protein
MTDVTAANAAAGPTRRQLNRATLLALGSAAAILVTAVLPAEYGVDPTGIGRVLGLTAMGERRMAEASSGTAPVGPVAGDDVSTMPDGSRRVRIVIGPYGGREAKAIMNAGDTIRYRWTSDGAPVEFEFHGDPSVPQKPGDYTSYQKGSAATAEGTFRAGFAGNHGWFWKNTTSQPVVITATVTGAVSKFVPIYAAGEDADTAARATPAMAPGMADAGPYDIRLPLKTLMTDVFQRSAQQIWDRQAYISDASGVRSMFPKTDEEWKSARDDAVRLAELTNILLIPGRRVDETAWSDSVASVRKAALDLSALTAKKNDDAYMEGGLKLSEACASCHQRYAPAVE